MRGEVQIWGSAGGLRPHHTVLSEEKLEDTAPHLKNFFGSLSRVDDKAVTVP